MKHIHYFHSQKWHNRSLGSRRFSEFYLIPCSRIVLYFFLDAFTNSNYFTLISKQMLLIILPLNTVYSVCTLYSIVQDKLIFTLAVRNKTAVWLDSAR